MLEHATTAERTKLKLRDRRAAGESPKMPSWMPSKGPTTQKSHSARTHPQERCTAQIVSMPAAVAAGLQGL